LISLKTWQAVNEVVDSLLFFTPPVFLREGVMTLRVLACAAMPEGSQNIKYLKENDLT
jgi:hypothetical protein